MSPTLKSRGTSYVLVPLTFTTTFILICWPPYNQNRSSAPNHQAYRTAVLLTHYKQAYFDCRL